MMSRRLVSSQKRVVSTAGPPEGLLCLYPHRQCTLQRLEGFEFCQKHITEDKSSPFCACSYRSARTGRRCTRAAPRTDRESLCSQHATVATTPRLTTAQKRKRSVETAESLLESLGAYSETNPTAPEEVGLSAIGTSANTAGVSKALYPFATAALDCESSDDELRHFLSVTSQKDTVYESGNESPDSEIDDPLRYAGLYSGDEAAVLSREKLIRLQALYIDQFRRLQHVLCEDRRDYLIEARGAEQTERESLETQSRAERHALQRYHTRHSRESLLHDVCRARSRGQPHVPPTQPCSVPDCNELCLPLANRCVQHIGELPEQQLYAECSLANCTRSVAAWRVPRYCTWHLPLGAEPQRQVPRLDPAALLPVPKRDRPVVAPACSDVVVTQCPVTSVSDATATPEISRSSLVTVTLVSSAKPET